MNHKSVIREFEINKLIDNKDNISDIQFELLRFEHILNNSDVYEDKDIYGDNLVYIYNDDDFICIIENYNKISFNDEMLRGSIREIDLPEIVLFHIFSTIEKYKIFSSITKIRFSTIMESVRYDRISDKLKYGES